MKNNAFLYKGTHESRFSHNLKDISFPDFKFYDLNRESLSDLAKTTLNSITS